MAALSKAEYLKRYLSKEELPKEERKKKRRRIKPLKDSKLRIIDDDIDFKNHKRNETALEDGLNDDAPTVAEIIDERPRHIQDLEAYRKNSRWKVLGEDEEDEVSAMEYGVIQQDSNRTQAVSVTLNKEKSHQVKKRHDSSDSDTSPPRRRIDKDNKSDQKRERVKDVKPRRHDSDSDNSPPRQMKNIVKPSSTGSNRDNTTSNFLSHKNKHSSRAVHDSDSAVARKSSNKSLQNNRTDLDHSSQKKGPSCHDSESDQSPMRRNKTASDSDQTPPRRKRTAADSDESPPRRMKVVPFSDQSPPRKRKAASDNDQSPPRKKRHDSDSDVSLPRRPQGKSNPGKSCEEGGSKDSKSFKSVRRSRFDDSSGEVAPKATKTLSGATAGLSSAKDMREEARKLKEKEERSFQNIDEETLGKHAKTVVRDKETGRRRNVKAEEAQNEEEERKKEEQMKKFQQWGKGLKQQAIKNIRLEDQIHEASKPLARYADDKDLDDMLRKEERAEDPMLAFFRTKKKKEEEKSGKKKEKELPAYKGPPPPPNRYNIMPGYRWDGVDRSNGFEKKIFAQQANKKAVQEMAYKWSTEDM